MSKPTITNVLDFIFKGFDERKLASATITADPEGKSEVFLSYINPIAEFENINTRNVPIRTSLEELEYDDAKNAIYYLVENSSNIQTENPSTLISGSLYIAGTGNVTIVRDKNAVFYDEAFYIDISEKDKSESEKFEYFIYYLKKFWQHVYNDILDGSNPSGIDSVAFARSIISNTAHHEDVIQIFYKDGETKAEKFDSTKMVLPYGLGQFYSGLFVGLNMRLSLSLNLESNYDLFVSFSDSEGSFVSLLGEKPISDAKNSTTLKPLPDDENPRFYHISGKILDITI